MKFNRTENNIIKIGMVIIAIIGAIILGKVGSSLIGIIGKILGWIIGFIAGWFIGATVTGGIIGFIKAIPLAIKGFKKEFKNKYKK